MYYWLAVGMEMLVLKKRFDIDWEVYVGAAAVKGAGKNFVNFLAWDIHDALFKMGFYQT